MKKIQVPELMSEDVQLQEMDWQRVKNTAKEEIREARIQLEIAGKVLELAEKELRLIWADLPELEREKRMVED